MSQCAGMSYNGWLYLTPRAVLDDLIERKLLKPCSRHGTKFVMTAALRRFVEASIWKEGGDDQTGGEPAGAHAAAG